MTLVSALRAIFLRSSASARSSGSKAKTCPAGPHRPRGNYGVQPCIGADIQHDVTRREVVPDERDFRRLEPAGEEVRPDRAGQRVLEVPAAREREGMNAVRLDRPEYPPDVPADTEGNFPEEQMKHVYVCEYRDKPVNGVATRYRMCAQLYRSPHAR